LLENRIAGAISIIGTQERSAAEDVVDDKESFETIQVLHESVEARNTGPKSKPAKITATKRSRYSLLKGPKTIRRPRAGSSWKIT
jgi:hypothetical protein